MLALLAAVLALALFAAWPRLQALRDRMYPARLAAQAIARSLRKHADTVGPVEVSGTELRLFEGSLRLVVSEPDDAAGAAPMGHFHVLATIADTASPSLDACIFGAGDSPEERL